MFARRSRAWARRIGWVGAPVFIAAVTACQADLLSPGDPVSLYGVAYAKGGDKGPPGGGSSGEPQLIWTVDDSQGGLSSDGNVVYSHTHPDVLADINAGRARLYTNQGKRKGKHQDPERLIQIDITGASTYSALVHAHAQTKDVVDVELIAEGSTVAVPFRVLWHDGEDLYTLRYGRECGPNVVVDGERADITRHDATSFTLRSVPGVPARLCINNELAAYPVYAPFSWDFVVDEP